MGNATAQRLGLTTTLLLFVAAPAAAQFDTLVPGIPDSANVLVIANARAILASPLANQQNWRESHERLFAYGQTSIPPNTNLMIVASELDLEFVEPRWTVAMLQVSEAPDLEAIANDQQGRRETVAGKPAVSLPDDSYLVRFDTNVFGSMAPADRQAVARWIRNTKTGKAPSLSSYLTEAYRYVARQGTDAVLAINLRDAVSVADVRRRLEESESDYLQAAGLDKDQLARELASIQGVMLGVNFDTQQTGTIIVDFGRDISTLEPLAKPMLLKVLADYGALIDEFKDWDVTVDHQLHRVSLRGRLGTTGRRRILSLITVPAAPTNAETLASRNTDQQQGSDPKRYATQQYFDAVQSYLDEFRNRNKDARTLGQVALWLDMYARKIGRLPLSDVYPEVRTYGRNVSMMLRNAAMAYKGIGIQGRVAQLEAANQGGVNYSYGVSRYGRYGWYGGYEYGWERSPTGEAQRLAVAQQRAKGAKSALQTMNDIYDEEVKIRNFVADKYSLDL